MGVSRESGEDRTRQAGLRKGDVLSAGGQGEHRAERLTGRSEFGRSLYYCLGAGLAGFGKLTPKQRTEPCSLSFLGGPLFY